MGLFDADNVDALARPHRRPTKSGVLGECFQLGLSMAIDRVDSPGELLSPSGYLLDQTWEIYLQ